MVVKLCSTARVFGDQPLTVLPVTLFEVASGLESARAGYGWGRDAVVAAIAAILDGPGLDVEHASATRTAAGSDRTGSIDLHDGLLSALAGKRATKALSFDDDLRRLGNCEQPWAVDSAEAAGVSFDFGANFASPCTPTVHGDAENAPHQAGGAGARSFDFRPPGVNAAVLRTRPNGRCRGDHTERDLRRCGQSSLAIRREVVAGGEWSISAKMHECVIVSAL